MSTPPNAQGLQCDTCAKRFKAGPALIQHSLHTGHGTHRYCTPCKRQFGTSQAFENHRATSKAHQKKNKPRLACATSAPKTSKTSSSLGQGGLSTPKVALVTRAGPSSTIQQNADTNIRLAVPEPAVAPLTITCRGNTYSRVSKKRHHRTLEALKSLCHPLHTLQRHGYKFNNNLNGLASTITSDAASGSATMVGVTNNVDDTPSILPRQNHNARRAVAIDCEMVGVQGGKSEVISLSAVDFLTGEEILHSLVRPHQPVVQWRTNIHGISPAILSMERAQGSLLAGWPAARAELFKHVDENTILVGHSLHHDLCPLRIQHDKIVDSAILASDTVFGRQEGKPRYWGLSLQKLCEELVGLRIREASSRKTHDGLEDALATREVVLWCMRNETAFKAWADDKLEAFELAQEQRRQARQSKKAAKKPKSRCLQAPEPHFIYSYE